MSAGSVPDYTAVLSRLMVSVSDAITLAKSRVGNGVTDREAYRENVIQAFLRITEPYLDDLGNVQKYGAAVTVRAYGIRNRDDIIRRIRIGIHNEVEESYARLSLR